MDIGKKWDFPNRSSLGAIIFQSGQFTSIGGRLWDKANNPNLLRGTDKIAYETALTVAPLVYYGLIPDPTNGAVFFHSGWPPPSGHQKMIDRKTIEEKGKRIGGHYFYRYR
jgi:hypothetical protein